MRFAAFQKIISQIKVSDLPGESAQMLMAPPFREELIQRHKAEGRSPKSAAVLALFYPDDNNTTTLVFIVRNSYDGVHSGQIGFPGGKPEPQDLSMADTACRETWEEVGVEMASIELIRPMTSLYIPPSNYDVFPFLGMTPKTPSFKLQASEVKSIIEVTLSDILELKNQNYTTVKTSYGPHVRVPAFTFKDQIVWGATAMILMEIMILFQSILKK